MNVGAAAFSGFELIGRRPAAVLAWGVAYLVLGLAPVAAVYAFMGPGLFDSYRDLIHGAAERAATGQPPDMAAMMALQMRMMAFSPIVWLVGIIARAVLIAAVFRAVLRPQDRAFFSLRLGMDEVWQGLLYLCMIFIMVGVMLAATLGGGAIGVVSFLIAKATPEPWTGWVQALGVLAAVVACVWLYAWLLLKLALAGPMTFDTRRFALGEAWTLSRGHTLQLLLMALLQLVILFAVEIVVGTVIAVAVLAIAGSGALHAEHLHSLLRQPPAQWIGALGPWILGLAVLVSLLSGALMAIFLAPWAEAYRQIRDRAGAHAS